MRKSFFVWGVVCLFCAYNSLGQDLVISKSSLFVKQNSFELNLRIRSGEEDKSRVCEFEILNNDDESIAQIRTKFGIRRGEYNHKVSIPINVMPDESLVSIRWFRLRYNFGVKSEIISLSMILKNDFELRGGSLEKVSKGSKYRVMGLAVDPVSLKGIPNVEVIANLTFTDELEDFKTTFSKKSATNSEGMVAFEFEIPRDFDFEIEHATANLSGRIGGLIRKTNQEFDVAKDQTKAILQTDKSIYQPGQELNIRILGLKGQSELRPLKGESFDCEIYDNEENRIYKETITTSDYGIAFTKWNIPANAGNGSYKIELKYDGEIIENKFVTIKPYELPTFIVNARTLKPYYLPNEPEAEIEILANYLFGQEVKHGNVTVVRQDDDSNDKPNESDNSSSQNLSDDSLKGEGRYIAKVNLSSEFAKLSEDKWVKYRDVSFAVFVTDFSSNRTEQRRIDVRITKEPIHIRFLPDRRSSARGEKIFGFLTASYADGTPARVTAEMNQKGYYRTQEGYQSQGSNEPRDSIKIKTNSLGVARFEISPLNVAGYDFEEIGINIKAKDDFGNLGTLTFDQNWNRIELNSGDSQIQFKTNKAIYKPGENILLSIRSNLTNRTFTAEVLKDHAPISSTFVKLENGNATVKIPSTNNFSGELTVAVYGFDNDDEIVSEAHGVVFPKVPDINIDAKFDRDAYRPAESGKIHFDVTDSRGKGVQSVIGMVTYDKAVDERARTDSEFGMNAFNGSGFLDYQTLNTISISSLESLDVSKPISDDVQLAAALILNEKFDMANSYESENYVSSPGYAYGNNLRKLVQPFIAALEKNYRDNNYEYPKDRNSFDAIIKKLNLNFDALRDPWGMPLTVKFSMSQAYGLTSIQSSGPDKIANTDDDFEVAYTKFGYFILTGKRIDEAIIDFHNRQNDFIRNERDLLAELGVSELLDRFGNRYYFGFSVEGSKLKLRVSSKGENGRIDFASWMSDDFEVWTNEIDFFSPFDSKISALVNRTQTIPLEIDDFSEILRKENLDPIGYLAAIGINAKIFKTVGTRFADRIRTERTKVFGSEKYTDKQIRIPVTQKFISYQIISAGKDNVLETSDDSILGEYVFVLSEQTKDDVSSIEKVKEVKFHSNPAESATLIANVADQSGSAIPGARVSITSAEIALSLAKDSNSDGNAIFDSLPAGTYDLIANADGFKTTTILGIPIKNGEKKSLVVVLDLGALNYAVEVRSDKIEIDGSNLSTATTVIDGFEVASLPKRNPQEFKNLTDLKSQEGAPEIIEIDNKKYVLQKDGKLRPFSELSTPRVRKYFPETLIWAPNLISNENGRASLDFTMADNLTTWKMQAIASTKDGKIVTVEKEVQSFQPFFVELDPPKYLTQGDEINLPIQVRNYSKSKQNVIVSIARGDWFSFLDARDEVTSESKREVKTLVAVNEARNVIFGFRADKFIDEGIQKVNAIGETESDGVEKVVNVRPNGHLVSSPKSIIFEGEGAFDYQFSSGEISKTRKAEIKLYPSLYAHVAESVVGLMERPHGCGEQIISTSYTSLLLLRLTKEGESRRTLASRLLREGYEKLKSYQTAEGGFSYWSGDKSPDIALTAYAIRFLRDASRHIEIDRQEIVRAEDWLISRQRRDGSWNVTYPWESRENENRKLMLTSLVAFTLATEESKLSEKLKPTLDYLAIENSKIDEPYSLALLGLTALKRKDEKLANEIAAKLGSMAKIESNGAYWNLETNTPFLGWGRVGRIETSALVLQFLTKYGAREKLQNGETLISQGTTFILKNKDKFGVWYSTQATINVLNALIEQIRSAPNQSKNKRFAEIELDGKLIEKVELPSIDEVSAPINVDVVRHLSEQSGSLKVRISDRSVLMAQLVVSNYQDWEATDISNRDVNSSRQIALDYSCDKFDAKVMEEIRCHVDAKRIGFRGYGMMLAEIGTPPGADIDRESLEKAKHQGIISKYDVLPDRIVFYLWARPEGSNFDFVMRIRYAIRAQTPESFLYDYYNEDAKATLRPLKFSVK